MLSAKPSCRRGASGARAASISTSGASSSYVTSTCSAASSAFARLSATIATTGSPTQVTLSIASGYCGGDFMPLKCNSVPTHGSHTFATSRPSATRRTPGMVFARDTSIATMRAWAWGLRTKAACSMRGR